MYAGASREAETGCSDSRHPWHATHAEIARTYLVKTFFIPPSLEVTHIQTFAESFD